MNRWDIINHFIKKNNYKSYLEIGYYKGWSFDKVAGVELKIAVDPNPSKEEWMLKDTWGTFGDIQNGVRVQIIKNTSDAFFETLHEDKKVDIVFIDGLHEASQVYKDIMNSLDHLSEGGIIVLHDCNPPKYEHTTTGIDGCWTGDTYKAFIKFRFNYPEYGGYTIDTDWGCGVIKNFNHPMTEVYIDSLYKGEHIRKYIDSWELFDQHRVDLLDLISVEEFLEREK